MRGRPPTANPQDGGARRTVEWTELGSSPIEGTPALPKGRRWRKATRDWYAAWCESPMASQFMPTDWQAMHRLARLVDEFDRAPTVAKARAITMAEAKWGATIADRLQLRLRVRPPASSSPVEEPAEAPAPAKAKARRDPRRLQVVS